MNKGRADEEDREANTDQLIAQYLALESDQRRAYPLQRGTDRRPTTELLWRQ